MNTLASGTARPTGYRYGVKPFNATRVLTWGLFAEMVGDAAAHGQSIHPLLRLCDTRFDADAHLADDRDLHWPPLPRWLR